MEIPDPDHASALRALQADRLDEAQALCEGVLERRPTDAVAAGILGAVSLKQGRLDKSLQWLEQARTAGISDMTLLCNLGETYRRLGRLNEAYACLEQAIRLDRSSPAPFLNMGWLMRDRGNARFAEHFFRSALQLSPDMGKAFYALAELYREEGHARESQAEYANALRQENTNARWHARLGTLKLEIGDTREAAAELAHAVRLNPREAGFHLDLARAEFELCNEGAAQASLLRGLELDAQTQGHRRAVAARYEPVPAWCEHNPNSECVMLSNEYALMLPELQTMPPEAAAHFTVGVPVAPATFRARVSGVQVLPREFALLTPDRRLLVDGLVNLAHQYPQKGLYAHHSADDGRVLLHLPEKSLEIDRPCAILGGGGDQFAWMFDALPRLWALEQAPDVGAVGLIVPAGLPAERIAMLAAMGVDAGRLVFLPDDHTLLAHELYASSLLSLGHWVSPVALQFVRRKLGRAGLPGSATRRVYFTRRGMQDSRLANEAELLHILEKSGFEIVAMSGLAPLEVMAIMREAQAILTVDGEVLANLPAAPQGALVGAIVANGIYTTRTYMVSSQLGQRFYYLIGEAVFGSSPSIEQCDIVLAADRLNAFLRQLP